MADKDYAAIARKKITRPSKSTRKPKIFVYSRNKKGKTKFVMTASERSDYGDILILDPEHGTDRYKKADPPVWHMTQWEDLQEAYGFLRTGKHSYKWVSPDGLTRMSNMALRYVMGIAEDKDLDRKPGMVQKKDYGQAGELMKQMLINFHNLDMGVIYTAQERMITGASGDADDEDDSAFFVADLPAGARAAANSIVDVIGRLYVTDVPVRLKNGTEDIRRKRVLYIGENPKYDTGARSDFDLPDRLIAPTVPKLVKLMAEGLKKPK